MRNLISPLDWTLCREARILPTSVVKVTSTSRLGKKQYVIYFTLENTVKTEICTRKKFDLSIPINGHTYDDFPKISDHFVKIFKMLSGGHTTVSQKFPKIFENCQGRSEDVLT